MLAGGPQLSRKLLNYEDLIALQLTHIKIKSKPATHYNVYIFALLEYIPVKFMLLIASIFLRI